MDKYKVYIAAPFFNDEELDRLKRLRMYLNQTEFNDFEFFFPMDFKIDQAWSISNPEWAMRVFRKDKQELFNADFVIAIYDSHYSDSGTAWELGYAHALGIPVKLLCTNLQSNNSLMTVCSADEIYDFEGFLKGENPIEFNKLINLK